MGHRQQMTPKQLSQFDSNAYKRRLEANRGHNHSYMTDELYEHLNKVGYCEYVFDGDKSKRETISELQAIEVRDRLRLDGYFARIISSANKIRMRSYQVWFKPKNKMPCQTCGKLMNLQNELNTDRYGVLKYYDCRDCHETYVSQGGSELDLVSR